jgi:hypothetical protein
MDLSQIGFAEFVGKLLGEVFDAVITAQLAQARQAAELAESARSTPEEAAELFVDEDEAVRLRLAAAHLAAVRQLVAQGVPRIHVDAGRVQAKLTFQLTQEAPSSPPEQSVVFFSALPAGERRRFPGPAEARPLAAAAALPKLRLAVRQASDRAPQLSRLSADVYGEVEVRFKTLV